MYEELSREELLESLARAHGDIEDYEILIREIEEEVEDEGTTTISRIRHLRKILKNRFS